MLQDIREKLFFNEKIKLTTGVTVYGHGHCINGFGISNAISNEEILPLIDFFHLENIAEEKEVLKIRFRIFPEGNEFYEIELNPFEKVFKYKNNIYLTGDYYKTITGEEWE